MSEYQNCDVSLGLLHLVVEVCVAYSMQATLVTLFFAWITAVLASSSTGFRNLKLSRSVDLTGSYVKEVVHVVAENAGSDPLASYLVPITEVENNELAIFEAQTKSSESLGVQKAPPTDEGLVLYMIDLPEVIQPKGTVEFSYTKVRVNSIVPLPYEAKQLEPQLLSFEGDKYALSVYPSEKQSLKFKFASRNIKDVTHEEKPLKVSRSGAVDFGSWDNVKELSSEPVVLQFESVLGITRVLNLDRDIWVSHWGGTVSFDESYDVKNDGTRLSGGFSRLDFSKQRFLSGNLNAAAIRSLGISLPPGARETYYTDLVGNVSTSSIAPGILEVRPRYPIMGGWIYNFTVGWASDLAHFVHEARPQEYILSVPLLGGPGNAEYDRVHTRIILPEGASQIEVFDEIHESLDNDILFSYLDLYGRPTVELEYSNLVSDHRNTEVYVTYHYTNADALRKPLTYFAGFLVFFITAMILSRVDLSL